MIAVLLVGAIVAALPGAGDAAVSPAVAMVHPAGCHSHVPANSSPAPISFQCCVNGHHAAIPNAAFTIRPLEAQICGLSDASALRSHFAHDRLSVLFVVPSNSPPGAVPLRI